MTISVDITSKIEEMKIQAAKIRLKTEQMKRVQARFPDAQYTALPNGSIGYVASSIDNLKETKVFYFFRRSEGTVPGAFAYTKVYKFGKTKIYSPNFQIMSQRDIVDALNGDKK